MNNLRQSGQDESPEAAGADTTSDTASSLYQNGDIMSASLPPGSAAAALLAKRRFSAAPATGTNGGVANGRIETTNESVVDQQRQKRGQELINDNSSCALTTFEQVLRLDSVSTESSSPFTNSNSSTAAAAAWLLDQGSPVVSLASAGAFSLRFVLIFAVCGSCGPPGYCNMV